MTLEPWSEEAQRNRRDAAHMHACAMRVLHLPDEMVQGVIMDYIVEHGNGVPFGMLNYVPWYVAGYKAANHDD